MVMLLKATPLDTRKAFDGLPRRPLLKKKLNGNPMGQRKAIELDYCLLDGTQTADDRE